MYLKDEAVTEFLNSTDTESNVLHLQKMTVIVICPLPMTGLLFFRIDMYTSVKVLMKEAFS
jgi:hypothetical protein